MSFLKSIRERIGAGGGLIGAAGGLTPLGWGVGLGLSAFGMGMKRFGGGGRSTSSYENLYGDYYTPFAETGAGQKIQSELDSFDVNTQKELGSFQRIAASAQPTIADFIGASYAQGGRGLRGRQQAMQAQRSGMAAAHGAYNQFRIGRDQRKDNLLNMMSQGQMRQQSLAHMQTGSAFAQREQTGMNFPQFLGGALTSFGVGNILNPKKKYDAGTLPSAPPGSLYRGGQMSGSLPGLSGSLPGLSGSLPSLSRNYQNPLLWRR